MPVKYKLKKEHSTDIPKELLPFYVERDGYMILDADGAVEAESVTEYRDNNRELMRLLGSGVKNMADAKAKLERLAKIDPDEYERIKTELQTFVDGKAPKLEDMLTARTEAMKKESAKQLAEEKAKSEALAARLSKVLIDDALATAAARKGVLASAIEDVKLRGRNVFRLEHDEVTAYGVDNKPRYGKDTKPLSIDEWMDELATQATHLFNPNKGSGSGGGGGNNGGYNKPNPFSKKTRNLTEQGRLMTENPELAERLRAQAEN